MQYQIDHSGSIIITLGKDSSLTLPPEDNGTLEWNAYKTWLEEGNIPLPYVPPTPIDHIETLEEAQEFSNNLIRETAHSILSPTDWYPVRLFEVGIEVPEEITTFRSTIRSEAQTKITQVNSQETLEDLKDYLRSEEYSIWTPSP
jgi:hypothetical protein